ncbi:MAG: UDP-N-acetylglucosamine 2-epimerase [Acidobacteria bacterium OLB17]|nr:MAG: UDP-N-acetylglucosamine 2-epimerase [Acidobacteria bacterium OLB17]
MLFLHPPLFEHGKMMDSLNILLEKGTSKPNFGRDLKVLVLFGTRPEIIKLAPVIAELKRRSCRTLTVSSSQHKDLLAPFLKTLNVEVDRDLAVMKRDQTPNDVLADVIAGLDRILVEEMPDLVLVQGDTTTTLAGALAAFNRKIPVGHVEAGLRSGDISSPFPEEANRKLITQIAAFHFAATSENRENLIESGAPASRIFVTGNTVVDSLAKMLKTLSVSDPITDLLEATAGQKRILLTTHRRESFGDAMGKNLETLARFIDRHADTTLIFPVHPNPNVRKAADAILGGRERIHLLEPLDYSDFLALMKASWLVVSDSGGVQEEAPSLGKPLFVLRENTERPEGIAAGVSKLAAGGHTVLEHLLEENYADPEWIDSVREIPNPFGDGNASKKIVDAIETHFSVSRTPELARTVSR